MYHNIDLRVDQMMQNGLVEEVKQLKDMGLKRENVSMQGLGYKEILDYLDEKMDLDRAIYLIKEIQGILPNANSPGFDVKRCHHDRKTGIFV